MGGLVVGGGVLGIDNAPIAAKMTGKAFYQTIVGNVIDSAACGNGYDGMERFIVGVFGRHVLCSFFLRYLHGGGEGAQRPGLQSPVSTPLHGSEANGAGRGLKTGCTGHDEPKAQSRGERKREGQGRLKFSKALESPEAYTITEETSAPAFGPRGACFV